MHISEATIVIVVNILRPCEALYTYVPTYLSCGGFRASFPAYSPDQTEQFLPDAVTLNLPALNMLDMVRNVMSLCVNIVHILLKNVKLGVATLSGYNYNWTGVGL